ncbi:UDP-glucose 6-dehydrogenase, partial [Streptomyces solincola]
CLPKDIRAFAHRAEELGVGQAVAFLREVDAINKRRRTRTVDLVRDLAGGDLRRVRVLALGAAFKPDSDDVRDAPALDVASTLHRLGAQVTVVDPAATGNARRVHPELAYSTETLTAAAGADVVVLLTEWNEFRHLDPHALGAVVSHRRIVDGRHALAPDCWRAAGWEYRAPGRP